MSAELERAYAKLAEKADKEKIPSFSGVLARARQRRRRAVSTTMSAIVVLAVFTGVAFLPRQGKAPVTEYGGKIFLTFDAGFPPVIKYPSPARFAMTTSDAQRSYAMWMGEDEQQWIGAIDLDTGQAAPWAPLSMGKFGDTNGMMASEGAILLLTEQGFDNPLIQNGQDTIIAVDPSSGGVMWTLPYSFNDTDRVLYSDTLVISWNSTGKTEALDLRSGKPKWTTTDRLSPGGLNAMRDRHEFESYGGWSGLRVPADRRVVLHLADGRIQIRDVGTGSVLSERSGVQASPETLRETVIDGNLYWADKQGVLRASLTGSEAPQRIHTREGTGAGTSIEPCGPALICLYDRESLIAIDNKGRQAWRIPISQGDGTFISASGVASVSLEGNAAVYDLEGRQVLPPEYRDGHALWADTSSLLIFRPAGITGYSLSTRKGIVLGENRTRGYCSWNATKLVCPTEKGISVWTYALN